MPANKVKQAYIFGSYARGEENPSSDIDIAVDMLPGADLLDLISFRQDLESKLDLRVDVTTRKSIVPELRNILNPT